jgi:FHA domain
LDRSAFTVAIASGDGLIARFGDVVMYIANQSESVGRLLAIVESAAEATAPATALSERLATETFGADASLTVPFVLIAAAPDGTLTALLRGAVTAEIATDNTTFEVAGNRASRWVDQILPQAVSRVTAGSGGGPLQLRERRETDLRAGVVPGGGFVLRRVGAGPRKSPGAELIVPQAEPGSDGAHTMIGASAATEAHRIPVATSSVVGVLTFGDDAGYPLDRTYVLGRDPSGADVVRSGQATPIFVSDDRRVSRVHAYVTVDDGLVSVRDASTPGGTYVAAPHSASWTAVRQTPVPIGPGWRIRIGERILTYAV